MRKISTAGFLVLVLLTLVCIGGCGKQQVRMPSMKPKTSQPAVQPQKTFPGKPAAKVLFIVAPSMFRDEEYEIPRSILEGMGCSVTVASATPEIAEGAYGLRVKPDLTLDKAHGSDFDAVVFVGGGGAKRYFKYAEAHRLAREAVNSGRVVGAICIAPGILAEAGVLQGKKCTAYSSVKGLLQKKGATYTGEDVVVDGKIVTANGPQSARAFGNAVAALLKTR